VKDTRRTIAREVSLDGAGLHLGQPCTLTFRPALVGEGIVFVRSDLPGRPRIGALVDAAIETERRTQLGEGTEAIHTVEHVLAAVAGHLIDDLTIVLDGPEPPIMDGSSGPFFRALTGAGIITHGGKVERLTVRESFVVEVGDSRYEVAPAEGLHLDVHIDFPHPLIGSQHIAFELTSDSFNRELADARTFGFASEVESLRSRGLIRGGSTQNAVVLDDAGVVDNILRWPDEFVRHKALDCVGDLVLTGRQVNAHITAYRPSHRATIALVRELVKRSQAKVVRQLDIQQIMELLPHRYPLLLVDRVLEYDEGKSIKALKNVTINEQFFLGHFPGLPVMPGVLIVEALAQVGGILLFMGLPDRAKKVVLFTTLDAVKWRRSVRPGDQLIMDLRVIHIRGPYVHMHGVAKVDGKIACEATMAATLRDK
jgi:UDP-3-O-[3-hydroxymyristoyl] N-acetylglucosamine deacetylase/3-hydroxyacyl-[acyl-carrier-protein] dehydratase